MNRLLFSVAFLLGAGAITWVAAGFLGKDTLALAVTVIIALVFVLGISELLQFRRETASLVEGLGRASEEEGLPAWLARLHPSLRAAVRLRIEGEPVGLPAPVFAPYLVGLLVMLGLLGTFVGMVVTLEGAVLALTGSADLAAIRNGLAAPIEGLGLAFGTSVAGVAASAALGLGATLSRRERIVATRQLDAVIAGTWREHSLVHSRQETFKAMQHQAEALPELVAQLSAMGRKLDVLGTTLNATLVHNQEAFLQAARNDFTALSDSVDKSLRQGLAQGARLAGEGIAPVLRKTFTQLSEEARVTQQSLADGLASQVSAVGEQLDRSSARIGESLSNTLSEQRVISEALLTARAEGEEVWAREQGKRIEQLSQTLSVKLEALHVAEAQRGEGLVKQQQLFFAELSAQLEALSQAEASRGDAAVERLVTLEAAVAEQLGHLGAGLEAPVSRLLETAAEGPKAATEFFARIQEAMSSTLARDNGLLEERWQVMEQLSVLVESLQSNSLQQREAVMEMTESSHSALKGMGESLGVRVETEVARVSAVAVDVAASATEVASFGDAVAAAVEQFAVANDKLVNNLDRIEQGLEGASARSNEQMGYYVAQAREIIDQSMLSQREIIDELRRVGTRDLFAAEAS